MLSGPDAAAHVPPSPSYTSLSWLACLSHMLLSQTPLAEAQSEAHLAYSEAHLAYSYQHASLPHSPYKMPYSKEED